MPHDCNGTELKQGDTVQMLFRVEEIFPTDEHCNVNLTALDRIEGEKPYDYTPQLSCNTQLVEKVNG